MAAVIQTYRSKRTATTARDDKRPQHRWRSVAANGNKLAMASEGYFNESEMIASMRATHAALGEWLANYDGGHTSV